MLPKSWQENCNGNFMKQNNNLKAIILLLSIVYVLFFTQVIYAKYMISRNFEINANSAKFYFDVISKEESETIKFNANKAEFNLLIIKIFVRNIGLRFPFLVMSFVYF